jgi:hypothetical protein
MLACAGATGVHSGATTKGGFTMRFRAVLATVVLAGYVAHAGNALAVSYEERSPAARAAYTGVAVIANVVPVVSTLYAPRCLLGYVMCKAVWAFTSVVASQVQLAFSGGGDRAQRRGILYRGFAGDWYLTGRHIAGDVTANPLPDPPPSSDTESGAWQPPPI